MFRSKCYLLCSALLLLLLSACAPGVRGVSVNRPLEVGLLEPATVSAGQTWYLEDAYDPAAFGFDTSELDQRLGGSLSYNPHRTEKNQDRVTGLLDVEAVDVPEGWTVELARATLVRRVTDVDTQYYYFRDSLELVFAVTIPAGTAPDSYAAMLSVEGRDGAELPLLLRFEVTEAATEALPG